MKTIKFQVPTDLWERFYRAYPGHGERSTLLRKIIRQVIILKGGHRFFEEVVAKEIVSREANGDG